MSSQISSETASRATLHMVAKMHYEDNVTQVAIAKKLGVSTATVSRMLNSARSLGIVRIEVIDFVQSKEFSAQLARALKLKRVVVIDTPSTGVLSALAGPVGELMKGIKLPKNPVLGIGWGRAVREVIASNLPRIPGINVVALNGGLQQSAPHFQINEFVRIAAEKVAGTPHFLHAPYVSTVELREAFLNAPMVQDTTRLWDRIDCAIVGVGLPHAFNPPEASVATTMEQKMGGVAGDVIRHYFDVRGNLIPWDGEERMIAASAMQLRSAKFCIAVAADANKATGIIGAARSGMISALVTDAVTAQAILDYLETERTA